MGRLRIVVVPPSRSWVVARAPAGPPVTSAFEPEYVVVSCFGPFELVADGFVMDHSPAVAVSVPSGLRSQPRLISRSSNSGPQSAFVASDPSAAYGHAARLIRCRIAPRLRAVWVAIFESSG